MIRPKSTLIVKRAEIVVDGNWRDEFTLECGHTIRRGIRKGKVPKRVICPRCHP